MVTRVPDVAWVSSKWLQAKVEGTTRARRAYDRLELIPDVFEIIAAVTAL